MLLYYVVYLILVVSYLILKIGKHFSIRATNKILLAIMYFGLSVYFFIQRGCGSAAIPILIGLFFDLLGDILLLYIFKYGGISFAMGGCIFTVVSIAKLIDNHVPVAAYLFALGLAAAFLTFFTISERKRLLEVKRGKIFSYIYMIITTLQGALGISLAIYAQSTANLFWGTGLALFMISDYFLAFYRFPPPSMAKKTVDLLSVISSIAYFPGMLLIAVGVKYL